MFSFIENRLFSIVVFYKFLLFQIFRRSIREGVGNLQPTGENPAREEIFCGPRYHKISKFCLQM